jgi:hypothetical protein
MLNSLLVTQGNFNSPSHGLAVVVKKRIPTIPPLVVGICFSPRLLNYDLGIEIAFPDS